MILEIDGNRCSLQEFIETNSGNDVAAISDELITLVKALEVGEEMIIGHSDIKRVA